MCGTKYAMEALYRRPEADTANLGDSHCLIYLQAQQNLVVQQAAQTKLYAVAGWNSFCNFTSSGSLSRTISLTKPEPP